MSALLLFAGILATWRVTHLITAEDGPWNLVARLRQAAGSGFFGDLMDCFYCSSLWVAVPVAYWVGSSWAARGVAWLALSGGAILVERLLPERQTSDETNQLNDPLPEAEWQHSDRTSRQP